MPEQPAALGIEGPQLLRQITPENQVTSRRQHGAIARCPAAIDALNLTGSHINPGQAGERLEIFPQSGAADTAFRWLTSRSGRGHVETVIRIGDIEGILFRMISGGPIATNVPETDDMLITRMPGNHVRVDMNSPGMHIDILNQEVGHIKWKWCCPQKPAVVTIQGPDAAALANHDRHVPFTAPGNIGIDPFNIGRIRFEPGV